LRLSAGRTTGFPRCLTTEQENTMAIYTRFGSAVTSLARKYCCGIRQRQPFEYDTLSGQFWFNPIRLCNHQLIFDATITLLQSLIFIFHFSKSNPVVLLGVFDDQKSFCPFLLSDYGPIHRAGNHHWSCSCKALGNAPLVLKTT
jgi:hypothetical protein